MLERISIIVLKKYYATYSVPEESCVDKKIYIIGLLKSGYKVRLLQNWIISLKHADTATWSLSMHRKCPLIEVWFDELILAVYDNT